MLISLSILIVKKAFKTCGMKPRPGVLLCLKEPFLSYSSLSGKTGSEGL